MSSQNSFQKFSRILRGVVPDEVDGFPVSLKGYMERNNSPLSHFQGFSTSIPPSIIVRIRQKSNISPASEENCTKAPPLAIVLILSHILLRIVFQTTLVNLIKIWRIILEILTVLRFSSTFRITSKCLKFVIFFYNFCSFVEIVCSLFPRLRLYPRDPL